MAHQQRSVSIIGLSVYSELIRSNHNKHRQDKHLLHLLGYFSPIEYMIGWFLKERLRRSRHLSENIKPFQLEAPGAAAQSSQRGLTKHAALHAASCALSSLGRTWGKKHHMDTGPKSVFEEKKNNYSVLSSWFSSSDMSISLNDETKEIVIMRHPNN